MRKGYSIIKVTVMRQLAMAVVSMLCTVSVQAQASREVVDSLIEIYEKSTTLNDSVHAAVNVFDAIDRGRQGQWASKAYEVAARTDDVLLQLDLLRNIANLNRGNDSIMAWCLEQVGKMPSSTERDQTAMFIRVVDITNVARRASRSENEQRLKELIAQADATQGLSRVTRTEVSFALCACLQQMGQGDLLSKYMDELGSQLDEMPRRIQALDNLYLSQAAINYSEARNPVKAVVADKKLLHAIDTLEKQHKAAGRIYRDMSHNRYISLRRLLSNYPALTPDEVEEYYAWTTRLKDLNNIVSKDFNTYRLPDAYYHMARKEYKEALPLLKDLVLTQDSVKLAWAFRPRLITMLIEASEECGDTDTRIKAIEEESNLLRRMLDTKSAERWRELQIIYDVNTLRLESARSAQALQEQKLQSHRRIIISGLIVLLLLAALSLWILVLWRRSRRLNDNLMASNLTLTEDRDTLKRTQRDLMRATESARQAEKSREDFINNVSHELLVPVNAITEYSRLIVDCIDDDRSRYLAKYARVVSINNELLTALVNDLLTAASYDRSQIKIDPKPVDPYALAGAALDTVRSRLNPGVELINEIPRTPQVLINVDAKRVVQVLVNLLANSTKFTHEGSIKLSGKMNAEGTSYAFAVTDTGIGIKAGKEEVIFGRFEKLDRQSQGIGLGLSIARLIAGLMGGDVRVDTSYRSSGSRFIFMIPIN